MINVTDYLFNVPFDEAVKFFAAKQAALVKTGRWTDMTGGMHSKAFTVAGATKDGMLTDFYDAVQKAINEGETLEQFRARFDTIVAKYGWDYRGKRNWRSQVIYRTNISTAYSAGRYAQQHDPDVLKNRP